MFPANCFRILQLINEIKPFNDKRYSIDIAKIKSLGWEQQYPFEDALNETIKWYKENKEWWKNNEARVKAAANLKTAINDFTGEDRAQAAKATEALKTMAPAAQILITALEEKKLSADAEERALNFLAQKAEKSAPFTSYLNHENPVVRRAAALGLCRIGYQNATEAIEKACTHNLGL